MVLPSYYEVIYIDTEGGFRPERVKEIAKARGLDSEQILQRIHITKALDSEHLESCIEAACSEINLKTNSNSDNKIKLLVVDSIIYHYRAEYEERSKSPEKIQRLNKYMHMLLKTAHTSGVAVVVTNHQTYASAGRVVPLGGNAVSYASKYRINLDRRYSNRCEPY
jgi:DNA repair protein RadA